MSIIAKTFTVYGWECRVCGKGLNPTIPECRAETHCYLEPPDYCGYCGAKLSRLSSKIKNFTIQYTYKHTETGEMKTQDVPIEDIEQGALSGFVAIMAGLNGYELIGREIVA